MQHALQMYFLLMYTALLRRLINMFACYFSPWLINSTHQQNASKYKFRGNSYYLVGKKEVIQQQIQNQSKCALSYIRGCSEWN